MLSCTVHGALNGTVSAPVSKSDLHRLIIACALSCGESLTHRYTLSQDIQATANVIGALGASVRFENDCTIVNGIFPSNESAQSEILCDCNESGSTLRFLVPVCAALGCRAVFTGHGRLSQRPMEPLCSQLAAHGVSLTACRCTSAENCAAGTSSFPVTSARSTSPGCCLPFRCWKRTAASC